MLRIGGSDNLLNSGHTYMVLNGHVIIISAVSGDSKEQEKMFSFCSQFFLQNLNGSIPHVPDLLLIDIGFS